MIWSTEWRSRAIQEFQRKEIMGLAKATPEQAAKASLRAHYMRIGECLPPGEAGRVLEVGCGPGRYVALLAAMGYDVVGVDPYSFPLWGEIAQARPVELKDGIMAEDLPFEDGSFDHVTCISALLYFKDPKKALNEMKRVMRPGGRLYVRTVNRRNLARRWTGANIDPAAANYYTEEELRDFIQHAGFVVDKTLSYGFYPPIFTGFYWYLLNGPISIDAQERLSDLTPADMRVTVAAFAHLRD